MWLEYTAGISLQVSWRIPGSICSWLLLQATELLITQQICTFPKAHYTSLHHSLQGQKAQQKELTSTNLSPWVYGASKLQYLPSADMLPLHMLSQGDPAFGRQQGSTVGGFSNWLLHKALRFQVPCFLLPHTVGVLVYLMNIHSFGKRNKHPVSHFFPRKRCTSSCRIPDCLLLRA